MNQVIEAPAARPSRNPVRTKAAVNARDDYRAWRATSEELLRRMRPALTEAAAAHVRTFIDLAQDDFVAMAE